MKNIYDLIDLIERANELADDFVNDNMTAVRPKEAGLDDRCGCLFINKDCIAVNIDRAGSLNYYGGFEYVSKSCVTFIGDYVFYSDGAERVAEHIKEYYGKAEAE